MISVNAYIVMEKYKNRQNAGKILASQLKNKVVPSEAIVLALPRGGVPVAYEIATTLSLLLDVFLVRKLGVPSHKELAFGAIASGGILFFNEELMKSLHLTPKNVEQVIEAESIELKRREKLYRSGKARLELHNKTIILVDDGIATGATARVAIRAIRKENPKRIILAVPVAAHSTCMEIEQEVDELICPLKPVHFQAVGLWFEDFSQTTDDEVISLLSDRQS